MPDVCQTGSRMVTGQTGGSSARFPTVSARTLLGVELALPHGFPAERTLAVVAFRQWHQARVDRWIARAVADGVPPTPRGLTGVLPSAVMNFVLAESHHQQVDEVAGAILLGTALSVAVIPLVLATLA